MCFDEWSSLGSYDKPIPVAAPNPIKIKNPEIIALKEYNVKFILVLFDAPSKSFFLSMI